MTQDRTPSFGKEFYADIVQGKIPGHAIVHKFGEANVGTTLQPITASGFYRTPTSATALEFVSDNANDTSAGSGAREVTIVGLDSSWNEVTQTVTTNGTAAVALGTNLIRLYRWYVSSSGTYASQTAGSHAGTLTIRESGGGQTWSQIDLFSGFAIGQSQIGVLSVGQGKKAYILGLYVTVDSNKSADVLFFQRPNADDTTSPYSGAMRLMNKFIGISGEITLEPTSPSNALLGPVDIGFMGQVAAGTGNISVDFELLIVDN